MKVFDLIRELTNFDPSCEIYLQDKNGDYEPLGKKHLAWAADDNSETDINQKKSHSSELFITMCIPEINT